ncbi:MAG: hypothetical protein HKO91_07725, partial [Desulfobacterales bacterium]|nr:hypothetical protein [Desulfobacterales bacterium]
MRKSNNPNYKKKKKKKKKKDKGEELVPRSKIKKYVHDLNNYPSPDIFQNKYNEKSVLIIGTG